MNIHKHLPYCRTGHWDTATPIPGQRSTSSSSNVLDYMQFSPLISISLMCTVDIKSLRSRNTCNSLRFLWQCYKNDQFSLISEASCSKRLTVSFGLSLTALFSEINEVIRSFMFYLQAAFSQFEIFLSHLYYSLKLNAV